MDGKTKPNELYIVDHNNDTSYEDNAKNFNGRMNDSKSWGEDGTTAKLINIATIIDEPLTTRTNVDG
jgi:hypothetical protein